MRDKRNNGEAQCTIDAKSKASGPSIGVIRVLVVDDHTVVRDGLAAIFKQEQDMQVVGEGGDGHQAVELWKQHHPDIAVMDLRMRGMDGVSAIYQIRAVEPNARIIILTTYDGDEDIYRGMKVGVKAYLLKDVRREDLLECVRNVHAGKTCVSPEIAAKLAERMMTEELTPRELEILQLLAKGKPNKHIASDLTISEVTVKSHVQAVFRKLNVLSRTEAIAVASRRGLLRI